MLSTRKRPAGAVLLVAACLLLPGVGRPDEKDKPKAPTPADRERELAAKLAGRTPDEARAVLDQLAQEWPARKGAADVAHQRFTAQAVELSKARQRLDGLKEPAAKAVPLVLRAADVEPAVKVARQLADYHASRVQHLETVVAAGKALAAVAAEFLGASRAAQDHLELMRAAPKLVTGAPLDKLPDAFAPKNLDAAEKALWARETEVNGAKDKAASDLGGLEAALKTAKADSAAASAKLDELKAAREGTLAAFKFEEQVKGMNAQQLADAFNRLRKELAEKTAAIKGDADDYAKAAPPVAEARARREAIKEPPVPPELKPVPNAPPLEEASRQLFAAQQYLAARVRTADERTEKAAALVAAIDEQEKKAVAYAGTLDAARQAARELSAVTTEIERRVGRGDLDPAKAPEGVAEAATAAGGRAKLDTDAAAVQAALAKLKAERETLRKPDAEAENLKTLTAAVLAHVTGRIDLLTDLKKLTADYATARKDRSESEQRRTDQRATERATADAPRWHQLLALDRSRPAADATDLLTAYYKELVELEEKEENLKRQKEALEKLVELTRKEADDLAKLRAALETRLPRGLVIGAKEDPMFRALAEAQDFDAWLAARLQPTGLKAEAGVYHDEEARLAAVGGANARRVQALTGNPSESSKTADQAKLPATGGEIGKARAEQLEARVRGLAITGIKIGLVLLAALVIPRIIMFVLRRAIRGGTDAAGNPSPVLAALRGVLKIAVWLAALAVILSILGYDVTAPVVAVAIVALALALAARPMIADVLGSVAIFADRRFQVGDVVRLGGGEPARVVGLTWRSTALKNANGLVVSVPNRRVTETTVENLSRGTETYDFLSVTISTDKDAGRVIGVIRAALTQCKNLSTDQGVTVVSYNQRGPVKVVVYRFWWFLKDYEARNKTRDEVFARIAVGLANEDMTGIELTLA